MAGQYRSGLPIGQSERGTTSQTSPDCSGRAGRAMRTKVRETLGILKQAIKDRRAPSNEDQIFSINRGSGSGSSLKMVPIADENSEEIENKLASNDGKIGKFFAEKERRPLKNLIEELYLSSLSRLPSSDELTASTKYLDGETDKRQAIEDLLWTLLNSKEFMFNH